jgi:hypothetical protein
MFFKGKTIGIPNIFYFDKQIRIVNRKYITDRRYTTDNSNNFYIAICDVESQIEGGVNDNPRIF